MVGGGSLKTMESESGGGNAMKKEKAMMFVGRVRFSMMFLSRRKKNDGFDNGRQ